MIGEKDNESAVQPLFRPLNADEPDPESTKVESLCVNCEGTGTTQILLTKIPFYKEIVVMSFECDHCGYKNNEVQSGGRVEDKGIRIGLAVKSAVDLNRQVCKSDHASVKIPELNFEIPQRGEITTVEGIIDRSVAELEESQVVRREVDPETASKIDEFVEKLKALKSPGKTFEIIIEDPSGNSFVSNPHAPKKDTEAVVTYFRRTKEQDHALGIYSQEEILTETEEKEEEEEEEKKKKKEEEKDKKVGLLKPIDPEEFSHEKIIKEVMQFHTNCPDCNAPCETNMKLTSIPYFKEVIIMATNCEACGHRSNEVKSSGGIEPQGIRIDLTISDPKDFTRDILKSETCSLKIPDLDLEVGPAALGGRFTTVEGILLAMKEQLCESKTMFQDSQDPEITKRMKEFVRDFDDFIQLKKSFVLVLDDPAGNSYVQNLMDPEPDDGLRIIKYERSFEQNEELGLNDIKVENYD